MCTLYRYYHLINNEFITSSTSRCHLQLDLVVRSERSTPIILFALISKCKHTLDAAHRTGLCKQNECPPLAFPY